LVAIFGSVAKIVLTEPHVRKVESLIRNDHQAIRGEPVEPRSRYSQVFRQDWNMQFWLIALHQACYTDQVQNANEMAQKTDSFVNTTSATL